MRLDAALLAQLVLLTSTTHAFFGYRPSWLEEIEDHSSLGEARRSVAGDGADADGMSFEIKRKPGQDSTPPSQKAAWQAALLSHKYNPGRSPTPATDGPLARRNNQYTIVQAVDPDQPDTTGIDQDGTDYSYFVQAKLGSQGTEVYMLIDTGAGSSWVMGTGCKSKACPLHNSFGPGDSDTFKNDSSSFSISYGSGAVSGNLVTDTLSVAGMSLTYQFGLASNTSSDFVHFAFDGILGLSMTDGANQNFLQALADAKILDKNIFGIALNRASDGTNTGEIKFGSTNPAKYTGNITYTPIDSGDDWTIELDDMTFNGTKAGVGGIPAYIDTGTSYVFGSQQNVKALHSLIPGAQSSDGITYTVPCNSNASIVVTFSGVDYHVSPKDWVSPQNNVGQCTSNVYGYEVVSGAWLLGDTFLKNVYAVFDKDQKRIGFANRVSDSSSANTTTEAPVSTTTLSPNSKASSATKPALGLGGQETSETSSGASQPTETSKTSAARSRLQGGKLGLGACISPLLLLLLLLA